MKYARSKYTQLIKFEQLQEKALLKFILPSGNSVFKCHNLKGIKLLTRLKLGLSQNREDKFKNGFLDPLNNPIYSCGQNIELNQLISLSTVLIIPMKD